MKHLKKFEAYDTEGKNFFEKYFSQNEYKEIVETISEIEKHPTSVPPRKGTDSLVNMCLDSFVFKFYKDYNGRLGRRVSRFPIPDTIYEFEEVIENIDKYIETDSEQWSIFKNMLNGTKHFITYICYFPFIRSEFKRRFNPEKEIFELFSDFDESKIKSVQNQLYERDGLIRTALFLCDSYNEIRWVEKYGRIVEDIDYFEKSLVPRYIKLYNEKIKGSEFKDQLNYFSRFFEKGASWMKNALRQEITVDDYRNGIILDKYRSIWSERKEDVPAVFEFTGDIIEDYRRYTEAYNKNR
jgi:hypothetical protein